MVLVRSIYLSQVYHYQNKEDHPGGSLSCGQLCKGQHNSRARKTSGSFWQSRGRPSPRARRLSQERLHISPSFLVQARLMWGGTKVSLSGCLWNNQVYQLFAVALGLSSNLPCARLSGSAVCWLLSL